MGSGEFVDLGYLGFRDLARKHTAHALSARMHVQHDLGRTFAIEAEECFEHDDHEIHRREIVVEQDHLIERWTHNLRPSLLDGETWAVFGMLVGSLGHEKTFRDFHAEYNSASPIATPVHDVENHHCKPHCGAC